MCHVSPVTCHISHVKHIFFHPKNKGLPCSLICSCAAVVLSARSVSYLEFPAVVITAHSQAAPLNKAAPLTSHISHLTPHSSNFSPLTLSPLSLLPSHLTPLTPLTLSPLPSHSVMFCLLLLLSLSSFSGVVGTDRPIIGITLL